MSNKQFLVVLIMLVFFIISVLTNIIGPVIPEIIRDFKLSLVMVSLLPFSFFIAYGLMSIPSGMLIEKFGEKKIMTAAFGIAFIGSLLFAIIADYYAAIIALFLIGTGMAMLQVAVNPLLRQAGGPENLAFNSVLGQLFFGLASFASPWFYSFMVNSMRSGKNNGPVLAFVARITPPDLPWISLYWIFSALCLGMMLVILSSSFPRVDMQDNEKSGSIAVHRELLQNPRTIFFFFSIFCYVGSEQGVANWISEFLYRYHGCDPQIIGMQTVSFFWGSMTAGTFIGMLLVKFFDSRKILIVFTASAMISMAFALFGNKSVSVVAFPLIGFFAAVMWPIILSLALNSIRNHHGSLSGILITGICGGAIIPLIIGWLSDLIGMQYGLCMVFITLSFILYTGITSRPLVTNKTITLGNPKTENI